MGFSKAAQEAVVGADNNDPVNYWDAGRANPGFGHSAVHLYPVLITVALFQMWADKKKRFPALSKKALVLLEFATG